MLRSESISGQLNGTIPSTTDGQSADKTALVDASGISLSDMGTMNSGGGFDKGGFGKNAKESDIAFQTENRTALQPPSGAMPDNFSGSPPDGFNGEPPTDFNGEFPNDIGGSFPNNSENNSDNISSESNDGRPGNDFGGFGGNMPGGDSNTSNGRPRGNGETPSMGGFPGETSH